MTREKVLEELAKLLQERNKKASPCVFKAPVFTDVDRNPTRVMFGDSVEYLGTEKFAKNPVRKSALRPKIFFTPFDAISLPNYLQPC